MASTLNYMKSKVNTIVREELKMKKCKKTMTWKKSFKTNIRAFGLLYKFYPQMVISSLLFVTWNSLTPYVGIYLSARIIDELAGSRNPEFLKYLVLITLITRCIIALVSAFLTKWRDTQNAGLFFKFEQIFSKKLFDMDFINIDDTKTHELLSQIRQNAYGGGWGFYRVIRNYESLISSFLTLFGGIVLTVSLFTTKVPESSALHNILNNPLFIISIIFVMVIVTFVAPTISNK